MLSLKRYLLAFWLCVIAWAGLSFSANAFEYKEPEYQAPQAINDPLEPFNRKVHVLNDVLDKALLRPVARGYRAIVPEPGRKGIRNFLTNLTEPITFANALLQRDGHHMMATFWRFAINSTFGIGGLFDVARHIGLMHRNEDFGQTMGVYYLDSGPYIVLPLLGPSSTRDVVGRVVDAFTDPFNYTNTYFIVGRKAVEVVDTREKYLDLTSEIERTALDPYATYRSLYLQRRESEIKNDVR